VPERTGWARLLSFAVHEFRSPLTVVSGYVRMLLKERAGPLSDQQRRLLEETEKSCARLSTLLTEMSELSHLEAGSAPFNRSALDVRLILTEVIAQLPELPDRSVRVEFSANGAPATVNGDVTRLTSALRAVLMASRREVVTGDRLSVQIAPWTCDDRPSFRITVGDGDRIDALTALPSSGFATFDEWRGGNGLTLVNARRIIEAHGGRIWGVAEEGKTAAIVSLPAVESVHASSSDHTPDSKEV
jgi:signal transduction histidine kinase